MSALCANESRNRSQIFGAGLTLLVKVLWMLFGGLRETKIHEIRRGSSLLVASIPCISTVKNVKKHIYFEKR